MSAKPKGSPPARSQVLFEIKSAQLHLVALPLKSADWAAVADELQQRFGAQGENPGFFEHDPLVLDFSALPREAALQDPAPLFAALRACCLRPWAFRGEPASWTAVLLQAGLLQAPPESSKPARSPEESAAPVVQEVIREVVREVVQERPEPSTLVIDKPVRSGQKIYARGGDLVVLAMVNPGAEIAADGNIHVYAPLRGKAMAGARGNASARIFSLCLEPELISIAGVYRTSETPLAPAVAAKPAQVRLSSEGGQDKLLIEPLNN